MTTLVINASQHYQSQFLLESFQNRAFLTYCDGLWQRDNQPQCQHNASVLTIWGQALTFYQLEGVIRDLSDVATVGDLSRHLFCTTFGETVLHGKVTVKDASLLSQRLDEISRAYHVDIAVQNEQPRLEEPGLLVMDMDSTVIQIECIDEIAKLAGKGEAVQAVTAKAMRGELDFNESLISRVDCLKGVPVAQLEQIRNNIPLMPGVQLLIRELKLRNWHIAIASGGFTYFADYLKTRLGLSAAFSNVLETADGQLTGKVIGDIVNAEVKAQKVIELASQYHIDTPQCVAMGDGANDLKMMEKAGLGVACHAKPVVNEKADTAIRFGGLHSLLYLLAQ
ncbi:phosphoserine phosphatase SerB [Salinimonas sp. HHU 13199]|uniref:Phosphoserine phosphatase n=1 Tax=Salinimonas profundi TaxID=2729140 RepID=A0ABR8LNY9_9ALTE|nr:phosphoserine phosphatase SerB [Salinimonas profundi]MBD3587318.1 phosphoserine phosphatase SerB [Salinimonas profundi]